MFIKIILLILINSLYSKSNLIDPILFSEYSSSGKDWITSKKPITTFGAGLKFFYENNNFLITSKYIQLGILGEVDSSFYSLTNQQSLPYIDKSKDADGYWSEFAEAKISYLGSNFNIHLGKYSNKWGYGINPIHISNKAPSYPQISFNWDIKNNLKLYYFHGYLVSGIIDSTYNNYYSNENNNLGRSIDVKRSIAGHRLEWMINDNLILALNETVIYAFRGLDINYAIPVIPFYPIENYLGDTDNIQMGFDLKFTPSKNKTFYLSFFMDELTPEWLFSSKNHNWFAWQLGFNSKTLVNKFINWGFEYNWTDQRIYKHKFKVNDFYSNNNPLGFWAGPHSQELIFYTDKNFKGLDIGLRITTLKRGLNGELSIQDNYKDEHLSRFHESIIVEQKILSSVYLKKHSSKKLSYKITYSLVSFTNVVLFRTNERDSMRKNSFDIGFFYNIK